MAKALQCPQCGRKHRIDALGPLGSTIRCEECGQTLRVPEQYRAPEIATPQVAAAGPAPAPGSAPASGGVDPTVLDLDNSIVMAAVRMESGSQPSVPAAAAAYSASAPAPAAAAPAAASAARHRSPYLARPDGPRTIFDSIAIRFAAWAVCTGVAGYISLKIGLALGYLNKDQGLQIVNGDSIFNRYGRLALLVVIWSLLTATLVQAVLEGGRWWLGRRES